MMDIIPLDDNSKKMVLALMNAEHPDAIRLYVRHYAEKPDTVSATLIDVSEETMSIKYVGPGQKTAQVTLPYLDAKGEPATVQTVGQCRRLMVGMARTASEVLGEPITLPEMKDGDTPGAGGGPPGAGGMGPMPEGMKDLIEMMAKLKAEGGANPFAPPGADSGEAASSSFGTNSGAVSTKPKGTDWSSLGGGNTLGGGASSGGGGGYTAGAAAAAPAPAAPADLREVDPDKPILRLRVQMLDRKPAQVVVNSDFTLQQLRAWLEHHMGEASAGVTYHLMDVAGFPPKKLENLTATVEELGITSSSSLACRKA